MKETIFDYEKGIILFVCDNSREATDLRDDLRDYGVPGLMCPNTEDWTLRVELKNINQKYHFELLLAMIEYNIKGIK